MSHNHHQSAQIRGEPVAHVRILLRRTGPRPRPPPSCSEVGATTPTLAVQAAGPPPSAAVRQFMSAPRLSALERSCTLLLQTYT